VSPPLPQFKNDGVTFYHSFGYWPLTFPKVIRPQDRFNTYSQT